MLSYLFLLLFRTLHSDAYIFPFLLCFSLLFFSQLTVRPPQTVLLVFGISFPWGWSLSLSPVQCHETLSIVHQALCQVESLKSISHFHRIIIRDWIYVIPEWSSGFPYFLQFKYEFDNKQLMTSATVSSKSYFADYIELLHLWLQTI